MTGMLAALNQFIFRFVDRCRPFYQLLKKWKGFRWDEECDAAFRDLKDYLTKAPVLTALEPGEDLFMYLLVSEHAVSVVLLRDQGVQRPVYYISKTLVDAETRYLPLEKLVLAGTRHQEVAVVLLGSYHICLDRVSIAVIIEEI